MTRRVGPPVRPASESVRRREREIADIADKLHEKNPELFEKAQTLTVKMNELERLHDTMGDLSKLSRE